MRYVSFELLLAAAAPSAATERRVDTGLPRDGALGWLPRFVDRALSLPVGASGQLKPPRLYKGQHERPREEVSNVGFVSALFSRTGLLIAIYIVIGVFVNTAPPHVPTGGANLLSLHSWVQYFISVLFWPLSFWTPSFTVAKWQP
jgi:hypothetical protein